MLSEDEKKAIENLNIFANTFYGSFSMNEAKTVLNLITKLQKENEQKDKQIDLMAETFYKRFKAELLIEYGFENEEQLKQYFAELVEKE